jgi:hypothetical protein
MINMFHGYSENTPEGRKTTKLEQILLNGNNICMVTPFFDIDRQHGLLGMGDLPLCGVFISAI